MALNYQTGGLAMDLNTAKFNNNGRCGYILKPAVMRESKNIFTDFLQTVITILLWHERVVALLQCFLNSRCFQKHYLVYKKAFEVHDIQSER